jgi:hypothetical protein
MNKWDPCKFKIPNSKYVIIKMIKINTEKTTNLKNYKIKIVFKTKKIKFKLFNWTSQLQIENLKLGFQEWILMNKMKLIKNVS